MGSIEKKYINYLESIAFEFISNKIVETKIHEIVKNNLIKSHVLCQKTFRFQVYYFEILNNQELYFKSSNFFRFFKKKYSLQGIDNDYLDGLEKQKSVILTKIRSNQICELYLESFKKAKIKRKEIHTEKDLGSFFSKLVHTFNPTNYCALDNPIKELFGLKKESFFIAFIVISNTYKKWSKENPDLIKKIRKEFIKLDVKKKIEHEKISDLKLLDLIFWSIANHHK
jgi:hypothetical protein